MAARGGASPRAALFFTYRSSRASPSAVDDRLQPPAHLAIGPCMFVAPLVPIVALLALPLWPVAIVATGVMWLVTWPLERLLRLVGVHRLDGAARRVGVWFRFAVAPWRIFDPPVKRPSATAASEPAAPTPPPDQK